MSQYDPNGLSAHTPGSKLDGGKPKVVTYVLRYFPRAIQEIARISEYGAAKYTPKGWEKVENGIERYEDAEVRHILNEEIEGSTLDCESFLLHKAHKAWNALAALELYLKNRDREVIEWYNTWPSTQKQQEQTSEEEQDLSVSPPVQKQETLDFGEQEYTQLVEKCCGMSQTSEKLENTSPSLYQSSIMLNST